MPRIEINGGTVIEAEKDKKLVLALEDAGIDILHRCGGNARCTTCRVEVRSGDAGPVGDLERERLAREPNIPPDTRLSCQIRMEHDLIITVINRASELGLDPGPRPLD